MRKLSYGISVGRSGPVKRETGASPVRCRRCKRILGSLDFTVLYYRRNGKKPDNIAAQARRPAFSAFAVTVHDKARETRVKSALDAKIRCII